MLSEQQRAFARVLDLVEEAGCMPFVALIGSWAEYVYEEAGILPGFGPNIRTLDVDFLIRNLRRPVPAVGLAVLARDRGFFVESDRLNGSTRILDASGLEVEFLILESSNQMQHLGVVNLVRCSVAQAFARPAVELIVHLQHPPFADIV